MKKGQVSIEFLMMIVISISLLSLLLVQIKVIEKIGEKSIRLKQAKEANETINSLCELTALTSSKNTAQLEVIKNFSLAVDNKFCKTTKVSFHKGKNELVFVPGEKVELEVS